MARSSRYHNRSHDCRRTSSTVSADSRATVCRPVDRVVADIEVAESADCILHEAWAPGRNMPANNQVSMMHSKFVNRSKKFPLPMQGTVYNVMRVSARLYVCMSASISL